MSNNSKAYCVCFSIVAILILIIALVSSSLKKLASDEIGVKYDTINKDLGSSTEREGLHSGPPGYEFIVFPSVFRSLEFSLKCLNKDGVQIRLDVTYQYKVRAANLRTVIMNFRDFKGYKKVLTYAGEAALHESCSYFNTSQFQSQRAQFQEFVRTKITQRYDKLFADITDLQVSNIERPSQYESAIRSKERAREDIQVALNERPRLLTEAKQRNVRRKLRRKSSRTRRILMLGFYKTKLKRKPTELSFSTRGRPNPTNRS
uniref:Uncharacterized protein LOC111123514 n=1 Tax=Crassostrea virginica TaxID=6565 RepID=A0A8B8D0E2_CRAVI|nr:uncharacterized protein LOC111123514 [Crassostrea virginica]XP_022321614.1 uncharacterized protein LOC111123514 [Crassostrea virginica]